MRNRGHGSWIQLAMLLGLLSQPMALGAAESPVSQFSTDGRNIYRLAAAELDGSSTGREIVGSTYDDRVCAFSASGQHLWDVSVGGFIFDLTAGDLDGNGKDEILAACADGHIYVIDGGGTLLWKRDLGAPVWQVATARVDDRTRVALAGGVSRKVVAFSAEGKQLALSRGNAVIGVVRMMRAGDFDGDGKDEVAVLPLRGQARDLVFLDIPALTLRTERLSLELRAWDGSSPEGQKVGEQYRSGQRPWNGRSLRSANGCTADLNGDGAEELLFNPGAYSLKGEARWMVEFPEAFKAPSYDRHYNMRMVAAGDLTDAPGAEVVLLEGCEIRLLDSRGKTLGVASAPFGFTDVVYMPGSPRGHVLLGSSPNGDDNVYQLRFDEGWEDALAALTRRGFMGKVEDDLGELANAINSWNGQPLDGAAEPYDIVIDHHMWSGPDLRKLDSWIANVRTYEKTFPYRNLRFSTCFWPGEDAPLVRPDGKPWGRDARLAHDLKRDLIVAGAKRFEAADCHFWVQVGHGCNPHCEIATCAAILDAAPRMCLGFVSAEDEEVGAVAYYFEHHVRPLLELCLRHNKHFIPRNKDVWWVHWPADPKMRDLIFNGRYRSVILPGVEDSNSRTSDAQLAARVGLWMDRQVDDWCCRVSADWFGVSRSWEWEYVMTGHPHLRYLTSQTALGARVFMFLSGERSRRDGGWTRVGREGATNFLHLLGKGVLAPPRREQVRAVAPIAISVRSTTERFAEHGTNGHHHERWNGNDTAALPMAFDRLDCYWAMAPLPTTDISTLLWGRTRRSPNHIVSTTPQGFVCLVPGGGTGIERHGMSFWETDGDRLFQDGTAVPLEDAGRLLGAELEAGATAFPLRVEGHVFHQIIEDAPGHLVVVLVDPGWLDPAEREVTITTNRSDWTISDRLTGVALGDLHEPITVNVPAGAIRLLDARQR